MIWAVVPAAVDPVGFEQPPDWPAYDWAARHIGPGEVVITDGYHAVHAIAGYGPSLAAPAWPDAALDERERLRRVADVHAYLDPGSTRAERAAIVRRYHARWLLLTRWQRVPEDGQVAIAAHVATHQEIRAGRLAGQRHGGAVDVRGPVREAVAPQLDAVGAEGVGQDELRAGLDIAAVDAGDQLRIAQRELLVAGIDKHALVVDDRAHRPVEDQGVPPQRFQVVPHAGIEASRPQKTKSFLDGCVSLS